MCLRVHYISSSLALSGTPSGATRERRKRLLKTEAGAVAYRGGGVQIPSPPEIPKALQNRAKPNPIVKNVKKLLNLGRQHLKMFGKKAVKF